MPPTPPLQPFPGSPNSLPLPGNAALPPSAPSPPSSLFSQPIRWAQENPRTAAVLAALAVGGSAAGAYYLLSSRPPKTGDGAETPKRRKNKKKKDSKFLRGEGTDGPLIEEVTPKVGEEGKSAGASGEKTQKPSVSSPGSQSRQASVSEEDQGPLARVPKDKEALDAMSTEERNKLGAELKDRGNKFYAKKQFERAVECYTRAIEVSVKKDAVFYSNRAACYTNYSPPEYEKCVADCDEALKLDREYVKALKRRATALEHLGREEEAIRDFTATTIIERFADENAAASVERCLKVLADKKAKQLLETREPKLPSPTFISSYLSAFRPHPKPAPPENPSTGDNTLMLAFDALSNADYAHAVTLTNEAVDQGVSWKEGQAEAFNLRGTFKFLIGDTVGAKEDLEKSLDLKPDFVQSWVKIASVHMELGDAASAFGDFEAAIRHNPNDPDIYYHRGQVYFITQDFDKAIKDYTKSTELDGSFIFTHVQQAVAQYKLGNVASSMAAFRRILRQFPDRGEPSNYYGELLLDQQKFQESVERFDRSLELDKDRKPRNVLPLVNKSLAILQWKQDLPAAEALCREALQADPECDVAIATMAQLSLQQGKIDDAITWFEKSARLARTENELVNAITYEHASRAQQAFLRDYPNYADRLGPMAQTV